MPVTTTSQQAVRIALISLALAAGLLACGGESPPSRPAFDSAAMILMTAEADDGVLITGSRDPAQQIAEIKQQLLYATGHLGHDLEAMPALEQAPHIEIHETTPGVDGTLKIRYKLRLQIAWKRPARLDDLPREYTLILPVRADGIGLKDFATTYGAACGGDVNPGSFFYNYSPTNAGCPLARNPAPLDAQRLPIRLRVSDENTEGKHPEYGKIWEDGRLDVAFISGNMTVPTAPRGGEGLIKLLKLTYGEPLAYALEPTAFYHWITATFATPMGPLNVEAVDILTDTIQRPDPVFSARFGAVSASSDLVAYNGHAGLGANIRTFANLAQLSVGRYYIYWINACRPFAYMDETLARKARATNPGFPASRFVDEFAVTNTGNFALGADVKQMIDALVEQRRTYREISAMLPRGAPAVMGEEDNRWPLPF